MKRALAIGIDHYPGAAQTGASPTRSPSPTSWPFTRTANGTTTSGSSRATPTPSTACGCGPCSPTCSTAQPAPIWCSSSPGTEPDAMGRRAFVTQDFQPHPRRLDGRPDHAGELLARSRGRPDPRLLLQRQPRRRPRPSRGGRTAVPLRHGRRARRRHDPVGGASHRASAESGGHGAFTCCLLEGLEGAASDLLGEVTRSRSTHSRRGCSGSWEQRPISSRTSLDRQCSVAANPASSPACYGNCRSCSAPPTSGASA